MGCIVKPSVRVITQKELTVVIQEEGHAHILVEYHNALSGFSMLAGPTFIAFAAQHSAVDGNDLLCVRITAPIMKPRFLMIDVPDTIRYGCAEYNASEFDQSQRSLTKWFVTVASLRTFLHENLPRKRPLPCKLGASVSQKMVGCSGCA